MAKPLPLIKITELCEMVGRSRSTIWTWTRDGLLPQPVKLHGRVIGWRQELIEKWLNAGGNTQ
ncbi:AlpA family phage regulatory protein [Salmonella enterica]|nr:AlpA family phage regulatory protein [Salmonella enterica subsp. houtenae]EDN2733533.1 transcriptional regulator [Salmonella enterica]EGS7782116.1 AlpA family phage regulatory protein [Salmonella enterica]HDC2131553.1 AlpA family phage regulatory protein [Salmonella enterica]